MAEIAVLTRATPFHPHSGGMERVAWDVARDLASHHAVTVITTPIPDFPPVFESDGVRVATIPGAASGRYSTRWWVATRRCATARQSDVVFAVSAAATGLAWTRRAPRIVVQAHGTALRELQGVVTMRPRLWLLKALRYGLWIGIDLATYRRVDLIVSVGAAVTKALRAHPYLLATRSTPVVTVPNAVHSCRYVGTRAIREESRRAIAAAKRDLVVLTVSRLDRQKGVDRCVDALQFMPQATKLVVVGAGPEEQALRLHAARVGVDDRIVFLGGVANDELRRVLAAADVFVLPVRAWAREGAPVAALEAMAAGLPIIAPMDSEWPADLLQNVRRVDVGSPRALARALAALSPRDTLENTLPPQYASGLGPAYEDVLFGRRTA